MIPIMTLKMSPSVGAGPRASPIARQGKCCAGIMANACAPFGASGWHGGLPYITHRNLLNNHKRILRTAMVWRIFRTFAVGYGFIYEKDIFVGSCRFNDIHKR